MLQAAQSAGLVQNLVELQELCRIIGVSLSEGALSYKEFVAIFAKAILVAELENVCSENMAKHWVPSLQLRPYDYKKGLYVLTVQRKENSC